MFSFWNRLSGRQAKVRSSRTRRAFLESLEPRQLLTGVPELVRDINRTSTGSDSLPANFTAVGNQFYFSTARPNGGSELWKSDGTAEGTIRMKAFPGAGLFNLLSFTNVNGTLYFAANDGVHGFELWKTSGTPESTELVKDVNPGQANGVISELKNINGTLLFKADDGVHGQELWKSDGTAQGTQLVADINPGVAHSFPNRFAEFNGELYFNANDGVHGPELWKSNGTSDGTVLVKDTHTGRGYPQGPLQFFNLAGSLYFYDVDNGHELWRTDGTEQGTTLVTTLISPGNFTVVNNTLFFSDNNELWKSNGTAAGTLRLKDPLPNSNADYLRGLVNVNGTLFFTSKSSIQTHNLWKSDGTENGTVLVKDFRAGGAQLNALDSPVIGNTLYFAATEGTNGLELWKSDGTTTGTSLVKDIATGRSGSFPRYLFHFQGTLFFQAQDTTHGAELWKSDGTAAGTQLLKDIVNSNASSDISGITNVNGTLYFSANDGPHGLELWKSNGTTAGTTLVKDVFPGNKSPFFNDGPRDITNVNGKVYFTEYTAEFGFEPWVSDGTTPGTRLLSDIRPGIESSLASRFTKLGATTIFHSNTPTGGSVWKTDGTTAGTVELKSLGEGTMILDFLEFNGEKLFFVNTSQATELWRTNGTTSGTNKISEQPLFGGAEVSLNSFVVSKGNLYYAIARKTRNTLDALEIWRTDGSADGTVKLKEYTDLAIANRVLRSAVGDAVYLDLLSSNGEVEQLWKIQGDAFELVKTFSHGATTRYQTILHTTNVNGTLYFYAADDAHGRELWKSDGTVAGTVLVKDINPGPADSLVFRSSDGDIETPVHVNGVLYFRASNGINGDELWRSDGTANGTFQVADIAPEGGSNPRNLTVVNNTLFFTANDDIHGGELWKLPLVAPLTIGTNVLLNAQGNVEIRDLAGKNDNLLLSRSGTDLVIVDRSPSATQVIGVTGIAGASGVNTKRVTIPFSAVEASAKPILVNTLNGNDTVTAYLGWRTWLYGGEGNDILQGGNGHDTLLGGLGNDILRGEKGNDILLGGAGSDILRGGNEHDWLSGGEGNDTLFGGAGRDILIGGTGSDTLNAGNDGTNPFAPGDLLIGGSTSFDNNRAAAVDLLTAWSEAGSFAAGVTLLGYTGVGNARQYKFDSKTVFDDNAIDTMFGSYNDDWYFAKRTGTNADTFTATGLEQVKLVSLP